jgi:ATP:corrinoid adenosyltransferase
MYNYLALIIKQEIDTINSDNKELINMLHNLPQNIIDNKFINIKLFDNKSITQEEIGNILIHKVNHYSVINTYNTYCQYLSNKVDLITELKNKK